MTTCEIPTSERCQAAGEELRTAFREIFAKSDSMTVTEMQHLFETVSKLSAHDRSLLTSFLSKHHDTPSTLMSSFAGGLLSVGLLLVPILFTFLSQ